MTDENKLNRLLSEFVDDLNDGKEPRLYDYLLDHPDEADEILPLTNFVSWFKAATIEIPEDEKESIANALQGIWTMRRLVGASNPTLIDKAVQSGLTRQQVEQLRNDTTPIDLEHPNDTVHHLSDRYGVHFFNLLGWVRQLITEVLSTESNTQSMSPAFTREKKHHDNDKNKA